MAAFRLFRRLLMMLPVSACVLGIAGAPVLPVGGQTKQGSGQATDHQKQDQGAAEEGFKISVDVNLVTTDVTVMGTPASDLRADDFIIYDDSVTQQTSYFSRDQLPLAVAILIDKSDSIDKYLPVLQIAAISALRRLKPEDQVALYSFDARPERLSDLTENRFQIVEKLGRIKTRGTTNIYDTIYEAAQYLKKYAPLRRRAIILISDNCDSVITHRHTPDKCEVELLETATTLYSIKVDTDYFGSYSLSKGDIKQFAEMTGGEVLDVNGPTSLKAALEKAIVGFRMQYTLGFNPSNPGPDGSFHRLAVQFAQKDRCPNCQIFVRKGYYKKAGLLSPRTEEVSTPQSVPSQDVDQMLVQRSIITAGSGALDLPDIPFLVSTTEQKDSTGKPQLKVDLQIQLDKTKSATVKDLYDHKLQIAIFYATEKGDLLGYSWQKVTWRLNEGTYDVALKTGLPYSATVPIKAINQVLKIVVYDEGSDQVGSKLIRLHNTTTGQ